MKPITKRQQAILDFIKEEVDKRGYPPSVREIGLAVGLSSTASVHNQLNQLEKKGLFVKINLQQEELSFYHQTLNKKNQNKQKCY